MFLDIYYSNSVMPNLLCIYQKTFTYSDLNRSTKCTTFMKTCKERQKLPFYFLPIRYKEKKEMTKKICNYQN